MRAMTRMVSLCCENTSFSFSFFYEVTDIRIFDGGASCCHGFSSDDEWADN